MKDGNSDAKLVNFMKQYRPHLPEAAPDFEQRVLAAIDRNDAIELNYLENSRSIASTKKSKIVGFPKWAFPAAIAASLLVVVSGYRALITAQFHANEAAQLEAFLVNNWEGVLNDSRTKTMSDSSQTDLFDYAVTADEPPTN